MGGASQAVHWALLSSVGEGRSCLTTGGRCAGPSVDRDGYPLRAFSGIVMESRDCVFGMVEVFCRVPDFIVFW